MGSRHKFLMLLMLLLSSVVQAQFVRDLSAIQQHLTKSELENFTNQPTPQGLPGVYFSSILPRPSVIEVCEEEKHERNVSYEVILVGEMSSEEADLETLSPVDEVLYDVDLEYLFRETSSPLTKEGVLSGATSAWDQAQIPNNSTAQITYDPLSPLGRELFIEGLVQAASASELSESELADSMARIISETYTTDDERYDALSALSTRLYRNYNNSRNPGHNNSKNNPDNAPLPEGDLSLKGILSASADFNELQGGVCNDISEAVAIIGGRLFPDKDVLAINSGSHFGVLVSDGDHHRIIDGGTQMVMHNQLQLDPQNSSTNLRISKVVDGALREIAVVDTQMGQVIEGAFESERPLLQTSANVSSAYAHFRQRVEVGERTSNRTVSLGNADLSDSKVYVVVAKYQNEGPRTSSYAGIGGSVRQMHNSLEGRYQVHFRSGLDRTLVHFTSERVDLRYGAVLHGSAMYSPNGESKLLDISGRLDFVNRLNVNYTPSERTALSGNLEVRHTLGSGNWGKTTGSLSSPSAGGLGRMLASMNFHLNQIDADIGLTRRLSDRVTSQTNVEYQGSNIGQSVRVVSGLNITAPKGAQILVFTGVSTSRLPGHKTQHSLLRGQEGGSVGTRVRTRRNVEINGAIRNIASGERPTFEAGVRVPIGRGRGD